MKYIEFQNKYKIKDCELLAIIRSLDILYLLFNREQALEMVKDYYDNADNIYNSFEEVKNFYK